MGNFNDKMQNFMAGRNGTDRLGRWTLGAAVVLMAVNLFVPNVICSMLSYALLFYCIYRMFSRNVAARQQEDQKFDEFLGRFTRKGSGPSDPGSGAQGPKASGTKSAGQSQPSSAASKAADKPKVTFACEKCGQSLSVPKGRGTLKVTCPKCNHQQKVKS